MTRLQIARIADMLRNNYDTAIARGQLADADTIARIARNLAVEFAGMCASFRFHSFYAAIGLTTDGFRPIGVGTP
jgi:hypothetical protein